MLTLNPNVVLASATDGYLAYDMHRGRLYRLNAPAALVTELCDGTRSLAQLRDDLSNLVDDNLSASVDWLDTAIREKLIADAASTDLPNPPDAATLARSADDLQDRDLVLAAYVCQSLAAQLAPTALRQATASVRGGRARALLDLGCGTGLSGDAWRHDTECLVGVDLSPEMVARARARCVYDRLDTAEITAWLSVDRPERYNVIIACDSLFYSPILTRLWAQPPGFSSRTG